MTDTLWNDELPDDVVRRLDVPAPRYTSYPTVPEWYELDPARHREALERAARDERAPLSLYVHVPFCKEMCLYCGCNVVVGRGSEVADRYLDHLRQEMAITASALGDRRRVTRVHWGGGTPTYLDTAQIERLWRDLTDHYDVSNDAEVAVEVDPAVTTDEQLETLAGLGFQRISMGVQDFDPQVQAAIHREQSFDETRARIQRARELGFGSVNLDLIYGLPRQTEASWQRTIELVSQLEPDRLAVFSFAYVPHLRPHQRKLAEEELPTGLAKMELQRIARRVLTDAGYVAIGMDHYAQPKDELATALRERRLWRDFQGYTVRRAADTVAIGSTGISDIAGLFAQNARSLTRYYEAVAGGGLATDKGIVLSDDDVDRREIITQLMCNFWVDLGDDGATRYAPELAELAPLVDAGLVAIDGGQLTVAERARPFVRNVAMAFDGYIGRESSEGRFSGSV